MKRRITENCQGWPEPALEFISDYQREVIHPTMAILRALYPTVELLERRAYYTDSHFAYENDGKTSCPGTEYSLYYLVPIGRQITCSINEEINSIRQGHGDCCLYFTAGIALRDSDNAVVGAGRGGSTEVVVAPYTLDFNVKNRHERITYGPYIASVKDRTLLKLVRAVDNILKLQNLEQQVAKAVRVAQNQPRHDFTNWNYDPSSAQTDKEYVCLLSNSTVRMMKRNCEGQWETSERGVTPAYEVVAFAEVMNRQQPPTVSLEIFTEDGEEVRVDNVDASEAFEIVKGALDAQRNGSLGSDENG